MSTGADGSGGGGFGSARMSSMSHLPAGGKRQQVITLFSCQYQYICTLNMQTSTITTLPNHHQVS